MSDLPDHRDAEVKGMGFADCEKKSSFECEGRRVTVVGYIKLTHIHSSGKKHKTKLPVNDTRQASVLLGMCTASG